MLKLKGFKHTEESKRKISKNNSRYWLGKHLSEKTKQKISISKLGTISPAKGKTNIEIYGEERAKEIKIKQSIKKEGIISWNKGLKGIYSEETLKKMSEAQKGNKKRLGKHHTAESKRKNAEKHFGKKASEETKRKMSEGNKGKVVSSESRTKISLTRKRLFKERGYLNTPETKAKIKVARAKQILPQKDTSIEVKIQNYLNELGIHFETHRYMKEIEHSYQCDIYVPSYNLIIECDGDYWHKYPIGLDKDHIRTTELIDKGFNVLRLWESNIIPLPKGRGF